MDFHVSSYSQERFLLSICFFVILRTHRHKNFRSLFPCVVFLKPSLWATLHEDAIVQAIDLVTVFDAILTSRQTCEKLQCLYENLMSNNFRKTAVLKKISIAN